MAASEGIEPSTTELTARRSTTELRSSMAALTRFERASPCLTGKCSSPLNYSAVIKNGGGIGIRTLGAVTPGQLATSPFKPLRHPTLEGPLGIEPRTPRLKI